MRDQGSTTPWGVTHCEECGQWTAALSDTQGAQVPDPDGDGVVDVIAYGAVCPCGLGSVQTVVLAVTA